MRRDLEITKRNIIQITKENIVQIAKDILFRPQGLSQEET